jgi:rhamnose transport system substrate-binding protein
MSKKSVLVLAVVVALALGVLTPMGPTSAQEKRWDGADNLPVSPLECGAGGAAATVAAGATQPAAPAYDGGQPTNPPDLKGKDIVLVDVPKLTGIAYFAATTKGEQEAAAELKNVKVTTDAPTEGKIDLQITVIDNYITKGVNGILFASNDTAAISPVLKKALSKGIHVVGYDANSNPDAREWFVNQATFNGIAKSLMDNMADQAGEDAAFGIVDSTFTTPNQSRWIAEMWAYAAKCHPKMQWLETVEAQEDAKLSFDQATTLLNKYGDKIKGLFGKVSVVGLSTPNQMKPHVKSGCVKTVVLWNPVDLGYAAVYVMRAVVDGTFKPGDTEVDAGRLGKLKVMNGSEVLLGPPFVWTKDNIDNFDF